MGEEQMSKRRNHVYQINDGFFSWRGVAKSVGNAMHKARRAFARHTKHMAPEYQYKQPVSEVGGTWTGVSISLVGLLLLALMLFAAPAFAGDGINAQGEAFLGIIFGLAMLAIAVLCFSRKPVLAVLAMLACAAPAFAGHPCRVVQQVHHAHHAAYVAPVSINYFVGQPIREQAIVQKTLRDDPEYAELQRFKQWKSLANGQPVAPEAPDGSPALTIKAKCALCHSGQNAKGGITLDGTQAVDDATFRSFSRMYLTGADVPKAMQPLMAKLTADEGSAVLAELLRLEAVKSPPDEEGTLK
jgi:hypothetical protein